mmetsp:Transcript_14601/g.46601  ORF Transcript_14601/g.46601 Transcript_14601/m.46601 type:complete len:229 (+) Transcript_14601:735-1421(+)
MQGGWPASMEAVFSNLDGFVRVPSRALAHQTLALLHRKHDAILDQAGQLSPEVHVGNRLWPRRAAELDIVRNTHHDVDREAHNTIHQHGHPPAARATSRASRWRVPSQRVMTDLITTALILAHDRRVPVRSALHLVNHLTWDMLWVRFARIAALVCDLDALVWIGRVQKRKLWAVCGRQTRRADARAELERDARHRWLARFLALGLRVLAHVRNVDVGLLGKHVAVPA